MCLGQLHPKYMREYVYFLSKIVVVVHVSYIPE